ncbi:MAG: hypothetical protein ACI32N_01955 [Bulleidia sp.]
MYKAMTVHVKPGSDLSEWCDRNAHYADNLYHAGLFRERQLMFAAKKTIHQLTDNALRVLLCANGAMAFLRGIAVSESIKKLQPGIHIAFCVS